MAVIFQIALVKGESGITLRRLAVAPAQRLRHFTQGGGDIGQPRKAIVAPFQPAGGQHVERLAEESPDVSRHQARLGSPLLVGPQSS